MGHSTWRSLRNPQYGIYLSGQMISVVGTWIQTTTLNWLVYDLTGSVLILGLLNLMSGIIAIPLGLLGGVIADRYSKKKIDHDHAGRNVMPSRYLFLAGFVGEHYHLADFCVGGHSCDCACV